jgi:hypothetical protein
MWLESCPGREEAFFDWAHWLGPGSLFQENEALKGGGQGAGEGGIVLRVVTEIRFVR